MVEDHRPITPLTATNYSSHRHHLIDTSPVQNEMANFCIPNTTFITQKPRYRRIGYVSDLSDDELIAGEYEDVPLAEGYMLDTARSRYIVVIIRWRSHERHTIARPWGRGMGCHSWMQSLAELLPL